MISFDMIGIKNVVKGYLESTIVVVCGIVDVVVAVEVPVEVTGISW